jgi:hypothetical protein
VTIVNPADNNWHRRHAVQVVCSLPDDSADALRILDFARELVVGFLSGDALEPAKASVVTLVRP